MTKFELITELKSDGSKNIYVQGYASTVDPDNVNDIVDEEGQKSTYNEISTKQITMDEDHEEFRDPETGKLYDGKKNKYPIAKVVETKLDAKGTWVKALLNQFHPDYNRIVNMIKEGYLHSFSIAYNVTKAFRKMIGEKIYRIIQALVVKNIGITGNPVNTGATFSIALKSFTNKMEEENKIKELEALNTELLSKVDGFEKEMTSLKSQLEAKDEEISGLKSDNEKKEAEDSEEEKSELKSITDEISQLKSTFEKLEKENVELNKIINSPQLKSIVNPKSADPVSKTEKVNMWDLC